MLKLSTSIVALFFVLAFSGHAQIVSGSIAGRVVDQQGAAVPGASVTANDAAKRITVTTKTNDQGDFTFPGLQPGNYTIAVEAAGFKKLERSSIPLDVNDKLALGDLALQVGSLTEAVEVQAIAALLQTESVERSATIIESRLKISRSTGAIRSTWPSSFQALWTPRASR